MQPKTSRVRSAGKNRRPDVPASTFRGLAPVALTLPRLDERIPPRFHIVTGGRELANFAEGMVDAGVLRNEHFQHLVVQFGGEAGTSDLKLACCKALAQLIQETAPRPLHRFEVRFSHDSDLKFDHSNYEHRYKVKLDESTKIGALRLDIDPSAPKIAYVGNIFLGLDDWWPGLGQTVLRYLTAALEYSCRALTPITGYGWCQMQYWMGELDESMVVDEQIGDAEHYWNEKQAKLPEKDRKPFNKEAAITEVGIFSKAKYDVDVPPRFGSGKGARWSVAKLLEMRTSDSHFRGIIEATIRCAIVSHGVHCYTFNDLSLSENGCWEACPYLLRWKKDDHLAMIWDDTLNSHYNNGDRDLNCNAAFAFHDKPSLVRAFRKMRAYLSMQQTAIDLMRALKINWL